MDAGFSESRSGVTHSDSSKPTPPAIAAISALSVSICRTRRRRVAPSADRTAISRRRGRGPGEQQVGHVRACDEQHESDNGHQDAADASGDTAERRRHELQWQRGRHQVPIGVGIVRRELLSEHREVGVDLRRCDAGTDAADTEDPVHAALRQVQRRTGGRMHREGRPQIREEPGEQAGEAWRRDADDGEHAAVERERLIDDAGIGPEPLRPHRVRQDDDRRRGRGPILVGQEAAPERRADAEDRKEVGGDDRAAHRFALAAMVPHEIGRFAAERAHLGEDAIVVAIELVVGIRELHVAADAGAARRVVLPDLAQARGIRDGRRLQQERVDEREDGGVGGDADGEREHRNRREAAVVDEHANRVSKIPTEGFHETPYACAADLFAFVSSTTIRAS